MVAQPLEFDVNSQFILAQLHHFYNNYPADIDPLTMYYSHLKLDLVYDHLLSEGQMPDYPKEIKTLFWELSAKTTILFNKTSISHRKSKDRELVDFANKRLKNERERFYKTYLTRKFLVDLLLNESKRMDIVDEQENKIHFIDFGKIKNE